jgi:hypothetical protein
MGNIIAKCCTDSNEAKKPGIVEPSLPTNDILNNIDPSLPNQTNHQPPSDETWRRDQEKAAIAHDAKSTFKRDSVPLTQRYHYDQRTAQNFVQQLLRGGNPLINAENVDIRVCGTVPQTSVQNSKDVASILSQDVDFSEGLRRIMEGRMVDGGNDRINYYLEDVTESYLARILPTKEGLSQGTLPIVQKLPG